MSRSWYFLFLIAIYICLNVWALWGVIAWWGRNGKVRRVHCGACTVCLQAMQANA